METRDKEQLLLSLKNFQIQNIKSTCKELQMNYSGGDVIAQIKRHYRNGKIALKTGAVKLGGDSEFKDLPEYFNHLREEFKSKKLPQIKDGLGKNMKMTRALVFWKFLREDYHFSYQPALRVQFVQGFVNDSNEYVALIAKIESLSDLTWRKILWRENIDFLSYESFLRRITAQQVQAIEDNFQDVQAGEVPRVYQKSFRDRMKVYTGAVTFEKLRSEESFGSRQRYYGKGAWAFSLLGLDFGFGKFPKGIHDDTQIENTSPSRFFSIKEHVNDFVVNQEDGKYWWMYKNVRSNFAFRPDKTVSLSSHICPGFWATLIMHVLFWIISPLVFAMSVATYIKTGASIALFAAGVSGLITPLWIGLATVRMLLIGIGKLVNTQAVDNIFNSIDEIIIEKFREHGRAMWHIAIPTLVASILVILVFSIKSLPIWSGIMFVTGFVFILSHGVYGQYNYQSFWSEIKGLPLWKKAVGLIGIAPLLTQASIWIVPIVLGALSGLWLSIVHFIGEEPLIFWGFIAFFASFSCYSLLYFLPFISERFFASTSKYVKVLTPMLSTIGVLGFVLMTYRIVILKMSSISFFGIVVTVVSFLVFVYLVKKVLEYSDEIHLGTIDGLEKYQGVLSDAKSTYSLGDIGINDRSLYMSLVKNQNIQGMEESSAQKFIFKCVDFTKKLISTDSWNSEKLMVFLLSNASPDSWDSLEELLKKVKYSNYFSSDRARIEAVSMLLVDKKQIDEIYKIYEEKYYQQMQEQRDVDHKFEKIKKFFSWLATPFIWLSTPFVWLYSGIKSGLGTIKNLWELFNERCPTVEESRRLD
ncbi:hypothetical protein H6776_01865 [Candidatus Nomurabacteria bacterium]|nr:hypothetical protein [Candidatus Nomurabacteria bacterium]